MLVQYASPTASSSLKFYVTVSDLMCVQRVLVLLTGRAYAITRFEAEEAGAGRWRLVLNCTAHDREADLLEARLHRLPSVLEVDRRRGLSLAATG
jgi:acetolactate synthase regulatory subunit